VRALAKKLTEEDKNARMDTLVNTLGVKTLCIQLLQLTTANNLRVIIENKCFYDDV